MMQHFEIMSSLSVNLKIFMSFLMSSDYLIIKFSISFTLIALSHYRNFNNFSLFILPNYILQSVREVSPLLENY